MVQKAMGSLDSGYSCLNIYPPCCLFLFFFFSGDIFWFRSQPMSTGEDQLHQVPPEIELGSVGGEKYWQRSVPRGCGEVVG